MSYLIFGLGLLLAIFGAYLMSFGYGIINVERGWASFIAGAAALSGGIITIALANMLHSLSRLRALLYYERDAWTRPAIQPWQAEAAAAAAAPREKASSSAIGAEKAAADGPGERSAGDAVRRVVAETIKRRPAETHSDGEALVPPPGVEEDTEATRIEPSPRRRAPSPLSLPRALDLNEIAPQNFAPLTAQTPPRPGGPTAPERVRREAPTTPDFGLASGHEPSPPAPFAASRFEAAPQVEGSPEKAPMSWSRRGEEDATVIGRYESEGTTYVMFADGSIEARSERGAFRFPSMAELKTFMSAQGRGEA